MRSPFSSSAQRTSDGGRPSVAAIAFKSKPCARRCFASACHGVLRGRPDGFFGLAADAAASPSPATSLSSASTASSSPACCRRNAAAATLASTDGRGVLAHEDAGAPLCVMSLRDLFCFFMTDRDFRQGADNQAHWTSKLGWPARGAGPSLISIRPTMALQFGPLLLRAATRRDLLPR